LTKGSTLNNGQKRWKSIATYYEKFNGNAGGKNDLSFKYMELLSFSYFQSSIKELLNFSKNHDPKPTNNKYNPTNTKLTDGSLVYGKSHREESMAEITNRAKSYINGNIYSIEQFNNISKKIWNDFEKLIMDMKKNKIQIEFFLAPYHPVVYTKIKNDYPMVLKTEKMILDYSNKNNIKLYGSFNPYKLKMGAGYFYDGMHCNETGIEFLLTGSKAQTHSFHKAIALVGKKKK